MNDIKDVFMPGEGYCEYNQDQIEAMRKKVFDNLAGNNRNKQKLNISNENKSSCPLDIRKGGQSDEEEGEYILGLA